MKKLLLLSLFLVSQVVFGQCDGRYQDEIFSNISKTTVEYTDVYDWSSSDSGLDMDIYQAVGDTATNRPLIVFAHGGVYVAGNKDNPPMISLCEAFAKPCYFTASIQYRLTSTVSLISPNASEILTQTVINSISDMKAAVRFFRKDFSENGNSYGINPDQIFVGGYSAGAVTAVHLSAVDSDDIPNDLQEFFDNSGGIEGNSGNEGYSSEVIGAISLAGAIQSLAFFDSEDEPIVSVHASDDNTVSYECDNALGNDAFPILCGSGEIHTTLETLGVQNDLYTFNSGGHAAPITNISQTAVPFISDFLYNIICETVSVDAVGLTSTKIYPNPTTEVLNIDSDVEFDRIVIFDNFGRKVMQSKIRDLQSKISTKVLTNGLYYLQIFNQSSLLSSEKVIKTSLN
ncbi:MAG: T9SS type A sorting domain-containing protein [Flavobacteriales bacterium]|nr:T9SS type A sorting domain-containing protein [Flavobacteriales bacterium]